MLELGVFGGKYMTDCRRNFPKSWFTRAKLSPAGTDPSLNFFGVDASQPLRTGSKKGWISRTIRAAGSNGIAAIIWAAARRRCAPDQALEADRRHIAQMQKHCEPGDLHCRPRQRQALLHWAYDSRKM